MSSTRQPDSAQGSARDRTSSYRSSRMISGAPETNQPLSPKRWALHLAAEVKGMFPSQFQGFSRE